jgi:hypothetical protein
MKGQTEPKENRIFSPTKKIVFTSIVAIFILASLIFFLFYPGKPMLLKAAIIDQLSSSQLTETSTYENQTFIETTKELLYKRFSRVDYYSDNATVDLYKSLISLNYKLIVWRTHSALDLEDEYVAICTSEKYSSEKYQHYLDSGQLTLCNITGDPNLYLGITPKFVKECMNGRFSDTVIVLMSCNGLRNGYYRTAETFIGEGVKAFISWDGWIAPHHNDQGITVLLHHLINENYSVSEAVEETPSFLTFYGPCSLKYYPKKPEAANYHIPDCRENTEVSSVNVVAIVATILKINRN